MTKVVFLDAATMAETDQSVLQLPDVSLTLYPQTSTEQLLTHARGAQVLISDIDVVAGEALAVEIGPAAAFIRHDASSEAEWKQVMAHLRERYGRLDILLNNAGYGLLGAVEEATADEIEKLYGTNVFGLLKVICNGGVATLSRKRKSVHAFHAFAGVSGA